MSCSGIQPAALGRTHAAASALCKSARRTWLCHRLRDLPARKLNYLRDYARRFRDGALLDSGFERFFAAVTITPPAVRARIYNQDFWLRHDADQTLASLAAEFFPLSQRGSLSSLEQFMLGDLTVHLPAHCFSVLTARPWLICLRPEYPFSRTTLWIGRSLCQRT